MGKLFCLLAILALTGTVFAGSIVLTLDDNQNGTFTIGYESYTGAPPVALALEIDMPVGETMSDFDHSLYDGPVADCFFDVFPDFASDLGLVYPLNADPATGAWLGTAHPFATPGTRGSAIFPCQDVSICMGSFVGTAPVSGVAALATLTITDNCYIYCILDCDTYRGGIIDANGDPMDVTCKVNGAAAVALPVIFEVCPIEHWWPLCWDALTQCHGDSDGFAPKDGQPNGTVDGVDWPSFRDSLGLCYPAANYLPCADYNRSGCVDGADWPQFRDNLGKSPAANCTPGDINEIYKP